MHKKLESDLISLAHQILKMKNKEDIFALKKISKDVYEKIAMLAFVEEYVNTTPNLEVSKAVLLEKVENAFDKKEVSENAETSIKEVITTEIAHDTTAPSEEKVVYDLISDDSPKEEIKAPKSKAKDAPVVEFDKQKTEETIEQPFDELEMLMFPPENPTNFKNDVKDVGDKKTPSLEDELQDTIAVDVISDLFENAQPKSLNDKLYANIQIGLNDRIAFVKHLFEGDQENYNRVISQLNTFKTAREAKKFINKMVKPDYNWAAHEDLEHRFMEIIARKFA